MVGIILVDTDNHKREVGCVGNFNELVNLDERLGLGIYIDAGPTKFIQHRLDRPIPTTYKSWTFHLD